MEANDNRRRTAIPGEVMYCQEGSCLVEKEEETMMLGGLSLYYECLDVETGERSEGRTMVDETFQKLGSPYCADLTFECVEDYSEYMCDGTAGDVHCKCMDEEMKKQIGYRRRRRTAIRGETLHCPEMHCLSYRHVDDDSIVFGPLIQYYECLNMETGEKMEATSSINDRRRRNLREDYTSYCTDVAFVCESMMTAEEETYEMSCDEYMDDTEKMIDCLKKEIHVQSRRLDRMEESTMVQCTNTCEAMKSDIEAMILRDVEVEQTRGD